MNTSTILQTELNRNPAGGGERPEGRWLMNIGEIARECARHGLDIDKDQCRRMLQGGQIPGTKFPGCGQWRAHTGLLAKHFADLLQQAS